MTHGDPETTRLVRDAMREALPDDATKARVLASLRAQLVLQPDLATPALATATTGATKLAIVVATAVLGSTLVVAWPKKSEPSADRASTQAHVDRAAHAAAPETMPAAELPPMPAIVVPDPPGDAPQPPVPSRPRPPLAGVGTAGDDDPLFAESALVGRARALVDTAPDEALALCKTHAARFPSGQLALEREAITVFARCARGDAKAASAAKEFLTANPDHTAASEIRRRCAKILARP